MPPGPPGPPMPPGPPGWGPPGPPRPPNNNPAALIVVLVGAVLVLLVGGGAFFLLRGDDSPSRVSTVGRPTLPDLPSPPPYTPPTYNPPSSPSSRETTYRPPERNWGAIAVASNGAIGRSWDYDTASAARQRALKACPASGCKVLTTFVDGCGAVAFNSRTNKYWGGSGSSRAAAQRDAISNAGGGRSITWVCTTR
ncbi:DUF4189 domain-containing protein [Spirillospora sp. CA-253888]